MKEPAYMIPIQTLHPGTRYHLHIECTEIVATQWNGNAIDIGSFSVADMDKAQVIDVDFQVDSTVSEIELHAPVGSGDYCIWRRCLVCLSADWQAMQALGATWFDGDSTFNVVTAKASVNIRGAF